MKVAVLGAGGLLGQAVVRAAAERHRVSAFTHAELDVSEADAVRTMLAESGPEVVINCTAYSTVDAAEDDEAQAMRLNGTAPGMIAHACAAAGSLMVHISTDYVFDGEASTPYRPDAPTRPINAYGRTKLAGETAVLEHGRPLIVRSSWLYAAYGDNFLTKMLSLMAERAELSVVADQTGVPTHTLSLARAIIALTEHGATGVHHFADRGVTTWHGFAAAIEDAARELGMIDGCAILPIATEDYPTTALRPRYSVLDCSDSWAISGTPNSWQQEMRTAIKTIRNSNSQQAR